MKNNHLNFKNFAPQNTTIQKFSVSWCETLKFTIATAYSRCRRQVRGVCRWWSGMVWYVWFAKELSHIEVTRRVCQDRLIWIFPESENQRRSKEVKPAVVDQSGYSLTNITYMALYLYSCWYHREVSDCMLTVTPQWSTSSPEWFMIATSPWWPGLPIYKWGSVYEFLRGIDTVKPMEDIPIPSQCMMMDDPQPTCTSRGNPRLWLWAPLHSTCHHKSKSTGDLSSYAQPISEQLNVFANVVPPMVKAHGGYLFVCLQASLAKRESPPRVFLVLILGCIMGYHSHHSCRYSHAQATAQEPPDFRSLLEKCPGISQAQHDLQTTPQHHERWITSIRNKMNTMSFVSLV